MQIPPALSSGSRVGIVATARKISAEEIESTRKWLASEGFEPVLGPNIYNGSHQFAGSDQERLSDLQIMLDDDSIQAILFARGGYGSVRIIDGINTAKFSSRPKWLVGYSDVTAIHSHINTVVQVATMHGTMPINIGKPPDQFSLQNRIKLLEVLKGESISYHIEKHELDRKEDFSGQIIGGNLSVLYSLNGSLSMPNTKGKVLFIEDVDEYLYHIDRMIVNLDRSGHLEGLAGLIVGGMTDMNDNTIPFGFSAEEIIKERVSRYHFPVKFGFPAGHESLNLPIKLGVPCKVRFSETGCVFSQD